MCAGRPFFKSDQVTIEGIWMESRSLAAVVHGHQAGLAARSRHCRDTQ
jgi:hypothetical protein